MDLEKTSGNVFDAIPENFNNEIIDCLVQSKQLKIERIVSKGHTSPASDWYDQKQDEWVVVLKGQAVVAFENGNKKTLTAGDYLLISAHSKHRVEWTDPANETVWLAIHYFV